MTFNPDLDPNYQAYLAAKKFQSGEFAEFEDVFIRYLCQQATATGTINSAMVTTAINHARATTAKKSPTF
jgi:hypothetical protein